MVTGCELDVGYSVGGIERGLGTPRSFMLSCELDVGYSVGGIERGLGLREAFCLVERELVLMGLVHLVISYLERHRVLVVRTFGVGTISGSSV